MNSGPKSLSWMSPSSLKIRIPINDGVIDSIDPDANGDGYGNPLLGGVGGTADAADANQNDIADYLEYSGELTTQVRGNGARLNNRRVVAVPLP